MHNVETHWQSNRFTFLLGALFSYVLAAPLLQSVRHQELIRIIALVLFAAVLISAVLTTGRSRRWRYALIVMAVATGALNVVAALIEAVSLEAAFYILSLIFLSCIALLIVQRLMQSTRVNYETLAASICAYLVLILVWANAYSLVEIVSPGAFNYANAPSELPQVMHAGFGDAMMALYYSFVTMTTLGYGDVTPAVGMTRMLAALQAFIGQIYVAVLIARLVGLHIATAARS